MRRRDVVRLLGSALLLCPPMARAQDAASQQHEGKPDDDFRRLIIGTWTFVSSKTINRDGTRSDRWGPDVHGILMFDKRGYFTQVIVRPKSRLFGTSVLSSFGRYAISDGAIVTQIQGSSVTDLVGRVQHRPIAALTEEELNYVNLHSASGSRVEVLWHRAK
jgi:hypothetical protein